MQLQTQSTEPRIVIYKISWTSQNQGVKIAQKIVKNISQRTPHVIGCHENNA